MKKSSRVVITAAEGASVRNVTIGPGVDAVIHAGPGSDVYGLRIIRAPIPAAELEGFQVRRGEMDPSEYFMFDGGCPDCTRWPFRRKVPFRPSVCRRCGAEHWPDAAAQGLSLTDASASGQLSPADAGLLTEDTDG